MTIDVAALAQRGERIGRARNATKADVWLVKDGGRTLVVKTLAGRPAGPRRMVARLLLRREGRVLARLRGAPGVPRLVEATNDALVVEWLAGDTLYERRKLGIDEDTARRLESAVAALHASGFAHGDIGRRDVIIAPDGAVSFVDFATAVGPESPPFLWRMLLPMWRRHDAARVAKFVRRYRRQWDLRGAGPLVR